MSNHITIFTGSRGEWGYLRPILEKFKRNKMSFSLFVSNMHLLAEKGSSYKEIENDGFHIDEKIYMNVNGPDDIAWPKSLGLLALQLPDLFSKYNTSLLLLAGDRAESLAAAMSAYYSEIPIAHIQAGERSGHKDGMARHAIGKLAHIHFASNEDAANRLVEFGEQDFRIFEVGAPQIDDMLSERLFNLKILRSKISALKDKFALCVMHPTSENPEECANYIKMIDKACRSNNIQQIWIYPNNDSGSNLIVDEISKYKSNDSIYFRNLERKMYLSLLQQSSFIIGNSSSGILEAPSFKKMSINLGKRQQDRLQAESVIHIDHPSFKNISFEIANILDGKYSQNAKNAINPYGQGDSSQKIVKILKELNLDSKLTSKYVTK